MKTLAKPKTTIHWIEIVCGMFLVFASFIFFAGIMSVYNDCGMISFESLFITVSLFIVGWGTVFNSSARIGQLNISFKDIVILKDLHQWSAVVRSRDMNKCIYCDETDGLNAHHIAPKGQFPSLKLDPENGMTLCVPHHLAIHDFYRKLCRFCKVTLKK